MFKIADKTELNQISLTGVRAIVLLGLLVMKPHSFSEIRNAFIKYRLIEPTHSDDILRIDLGTLKLMGCEISRASAKTDYKYILMNHPFSLRLEDDEIKVLKKVYNIIKQNCDLDTLLNFDDMYRKISESVFDEETKEGILGISIFKHSDIKQIKKLLLDCKQNRVLDIVYKKTATSKEEKKEIVAQKLFFKNDKIYLYGYDIDKEESVVFNTNRIKNISSQKLCAGTIEANSTKVKFLLKNTCIENLSDEEIVLEAGNNGYLIGGRYYNEFFAVQRILSFGPNCTVIEPESIKKKVIQKLREMRKIYE